MEVPLFNLVCKKLILTGVIGFHESQQSAPGELIENLCNKILVENFLSLENFPSKIFVYIFSQKIK